VEETAALEIVNSAELEAEVAAELDARVTAEPETSAMIEQAVEGDTEEESTEELAESEELSPEEMVPEVQFAPRAEERLQKILAQAGVASRRHAEELIAEGRVQVNGQVVTTPGFKADPERDHIRVDGKLLHGAERLRYFLLNKPRGFVTTVSDPEGRPTVMQFFSRLGERLYPVGRLDYQSEGLLLVTNDGALANKLTHASSGVEKTYLVKVSGRPDEEQLDRLRSGVSIAKGRPGEGKVRTAGARIRQVRAGENPWFEIVLIEGRNRELRKMFEEIGHHVEKIRRVGYGPLVLDIEQGETRELTEQEVNLLRLAAEGRYKSRRIDFSVLLPKEAGRTVDHEAAKERSRRPFQRGGYQRREGSQRPDFRSNSRPNSRQDSRPDSRQGSRPDSRQDSRPDSRSDRRPERSGWSSEQRTERPGFGQGRPERRGSSEREERPGRGEFRDREFGGRGGRPEGKRPFGRKPGFEIREERGGESRGEFRGKPRGEFRGEPRGESRFGRPARFSPRPDRERGREEGEAPREGFGRGREGRPDRFQRRFEDRGDPSRGPNRQSDRQPDRERFQSRDRGRTDDRDRGRRDFEERGFGGRGGQSFRPSGERGFGQDRETGGGKKFGFKPGGKSGGFKSGSKSGFKTGAKGGFKGKPGGSRTGGKPFGKRPGGRPSGPRRGGS
jgi:23S rRNA pseudouridine2605 synthase